MSDLRWDEVRNFFDADLVGALPEVFVPDTSVEDWQAVFDLVRTCGWRWEYRQGHTTLPLPPAVEALDRPADAETVDLRVWPVPGVLAIFRPSSAENIDFDVDLRELQGQHGVDILCRFLEEIGRELGKPVLMTSEGGSQGSPSPRIRPDPRPSVDSGRPAALNSQKQKTSRGRGGISSWA